MIATRLRHAAVVGGVVVSTALVACSSDAPGGRALEGLCCTDFKVGADLSGVDFGVDASIKGQFNAFAQASGDLAGAASGALDSVSGACRAIAQVGGANADAAPPSDPAEGVKFWCNKIVTNIINWICGGSDFADVSCGCRACNREAIYRITLFGRYTD